MLVVLEGRVGDQDGEVVDEGPVVVARMNKHSLQLNI